MYLQICVHCFADLSDGGNLGCIRFFKILAKTDANSDDFCRNMYVHMYIYKFYIPLAPRSATKEHFRANV